MAQPRSADSHAPVSSQLLEIAKYGSSESGAEKSTRAVGPSASRMRDARRPRTTKMTGVPAGNRTSLADRAASDKIFPGIAAASAELPVARLLEPSTTPPFSTLTRVRSKSRRAPLRWE